MEYRGNQCPSRGAGLSHMMSTEGICLYCDTPLTATPPSPSIPPTATEAAVEPVNVNERLESLGLLPPPVKDSERDSLMVEPRMITGEGPQGRDWKIGRGPLTDRQKKIIEAFVGFRSWLAEHGGGEEE